MLLAGAIGVALGVVLGLTGAGGAIFALPLFTLLLGLDTQSAISLSLATVAVGAFIGAVRRHRDIIWMPAAAFSLLGVVFAPMGRWVSGQISEAVIVSLFAIVTVVIARRMWLRAARGDSERDAESLCEMTSPTRVRLQPRCMGALSATGSATGFLSGLLGVGGGFLITPVLLRLTPAKLNQVVATSLLVIAAAAVSGALFSLEELRALPVIVSASVMTGAIAGVLIGAQCVRWVPASTVQRLFAVLALMAAVAVVWPVVMN
ncbi:conserved domain protein, putative [gamma proteobacterium HTCC5015]|nr:conserved domain protein, putative [gamma proteobacterium HTCC5015]